MARHPALGLKVHTYKDSFQVDVKRLRLPVRLSSACPKCGLVVEQNLEGDHYLSYPLANAPFHVSFAHEGDEEEGWFEHEWEETILLKISVEKVDG